MKRKALFFVFVAIAVSLAALIFAGCQEEKKDTPCKMSRKYTFRLLSTLRPWTRSFLDWCGNLRLYIRIFRWIDKLSTSSILLSPRNGNIEQTEVKNEDSMKNNLWADTIMGCPALQNETKRKRYMEKVLSNNLNELIWIVLFDSLQAMRAVLGEKYHAAVRAEMLFISNNCNFTFIPSNENEIMVILQ